MRPWRGFGQSLRALIRFRRRTILMMLGIAVGVGALSLLDSIGQNTRRETLARVKNMLGTFDTILIRPGGKTRGMVSLASVEPSLKFEDAEAIERNIAEVKQVASVENAFDVDVSYMGQQITPAVFGVSANWTELRGDTMQSGSFFTSPEAQKLERVAVLGLDVQRSLFASADPIGKSVRIGGVPFQVRGVLASRGAGPTGASLDNVVLIPVSTASRRLFNRDYLTMIIAQLRDPETAAAAIRKTTALLRERHHLTGAALDDFNVTDPKAVFQRLSEVGSALERILKGVAMLSMLIGGIVIMSLMTAAVTERRREIGVRRSVGATRLDVLGQFLLEAVCVSVAGGAMGALVGAGAVNAWSLYSRTSLSLNADVLGRAVALALAIGVIFGLYPAWRASRIDPIRALRS